MKLQFQLNSVQLEKKYSEMRPINPNFFLLYLNTEAYIHNFWLDANDIEREGHFIWQSTRQPLVYKNWNANEPSGGTEDCLEMLFKEYVDEQHIGQWNDKICSHENHFICEKR